LDLQLNAVFSIGYEVPERYGFVTLVPESCFWLEHAPKLDP